MEVKNMIPDEKAIAQRMVNAEESFIEILMKFGNISREEAIKAMITMLKLKVAKMDAVNGVISVVHGEFLEPYAIRNAVNYVHKRKGAR